MRTYPGISATGVADRHVQKALRDVDTFLRDAQRALSKALSDITALTSTPVAAASYLCVANEASLSAERRLVASAPLLGSDGGGNGDYTLSLNTSALAGTPAITYATTFGAGAATTFIRTDAQLKFPSDLMSTANSFRLSLTDNGTDPTLTVSSGLLHVDLATGAAIDLGASTAGTLSVIPDTAVAAADTAIINGRMVAGSRTLLAPQWFGASASDVFSGQTFRCWNAVYNAIIVGQITGSTFVAYDNSNFSINPSASSGADNLAYAFRSAGTVIGSANGSWAEVATMSLRGPRRVFSSFFTDSVATLILEAPTGTNKKQDTTTDLDQITLLLRQQTAQGTAPVNKVGLDILEQNAGTNRYSARFYNRFLVTNPSGRAETVLELRQLNTGATAGAHVNFDDKAGSPGSPVTGDLWRNADALNYRKSSATVDLALRPIPIGDGGTGQTTAVAAFDALAPTTSQGDIIYHDGTDNVRLAKGSNNTVFRMTSTIPAWESELLSKDITIESPTTTEDITIFYTPIAITVTEVRVVQVGPASPSLTLQLKHHTDRNNAGNNLTTSAAHSNTTTGSTATLSDDTIPAASYVWVETTAVSATPPTHTAIHIRYTVD